jgi:hypothetical protein
MTGSSQWLGGERAGNGADAGVRSVDLITWSTPPLTWSTDFLSILPNEKPFGLTDSAQSDSVVDPDAIERGRTMIVCPEGLAELNTTSWKVCPKS